MSEANFWCSCPVAGCGQRLAARVLLPDACAGAGEVLLGGACDHVAKIAWRSASDPARGRIEVEAALVATATLAPVAAATVPFVEEA